MSPQECGDSNGFLKILGSFLIRFLNNDLDNTSNVCVVCDYEKKTYLPIHFGIYF